MAIGVLVAGIGLVLAGLLAIGFGVPVKEFSFGNTLILIGALGVCSGAIMIALWMAIRELKIIGRRLGAGMPEPRGEITVRPVLPPGAVREGAPADSGALFGQPAVPNPGGSATATAAAMAGRGRGRSRAGARARRRSRRAAETEAQSAVFLDLAQRARARAVAHQRAVAAGHAVGGSSPEPVRTRHSRRLHRPSRRRPRSTMPGPSPNAGEPATFRRSRAARNGRRLHRAPMALPAQNGDQPAVTVLKSGVVDGMAYSLYSDGSIEAQMPEGMMRFASIDELRAHLDQRP